MLLAAGFAVPMTIILRIDWPLSRQLLLFNLYPNSDMPTDQDGTIYFCWQHQIFRRVFPIGPYRGVVVVVALCGKYGDFLCFHSPVAWSVSTLLGISWGSFGGGGKVDRWRSGCRGVVGTLIDRKETDFCWSGLGLRR